MTTSADRVMKPFLLLILIFYVQYSIAQTRTVSFGTIDWNAQFIDSDNIDTLAQQLTGPYQTEEEKVRSIYSWITKHIAYNTGIYNSWKRNASVSFKPDYSDTVGEWRSANEMTAIRVLHRRIAVCDGYAKLFKTLCDYAGIRSELITGYAKCYLERADKFRTNHTWNAVMVDSAWKLIDVTWASGYVNYADEFVQHQDDTYFFTPPQQFIRDHYPEDLRWTLMDHPPTLKEFDNTPFKCKSYIKYGIVSFFPSNGIINASVGDTVHLELQVRDAARNKLISTDPFFDSTIMEQPAFAFLKPDQLDQNKATYSYIVQNDAVEWLQVLYNDDVVMRYRLNVTKKEVK